MKESKEQQRIRDEACQSLVNYARGALRGVFGKKIACRMDFGGWYYAPWHHDYGICRVEVKGTRGIWAAGVFRDRNRKEFDLWNRNPAEMPDVPPELKPAFRELWIRAKAAVKAVGVHRSFD